MPPKSSNRFNSSLTSRQMVDLTRHLIERHKATKYHTTIGHKSIGKDWMHPKVRSQINRVVERGIFETRFDSRKNLIAFFDSIGAKDDPSQIRKKVFEYVSRVAKQKNMTNTHELLVELRKTIELVEKRFGYLTRRSRAIFGLSKKLESQGKNNYFEMNTADAFAHVYFQRSIMLLDFERVKEAIDSLLKK